MADEKAQQEIPTDAPTNPGDKGAPGTPGTGENICRACNGSGRVSDQPCHECGGTGRIIKGIGGG